VCDAFEEAFGLTYNGTTDLYQINSTIHTKLQSLNPTVTFKLGNTAYDNGNSTNVVLEYGAFDVQASVPTYDDPQYYFPIRRAANASQYTLGRTLLQEAYLVVDYERQNFTIGQAVFEDPLPSTQITAIQPPTDAGSTSSASKTGQKTSVGLIAGVAIGAVALIALAVAAFFIIRRRKRNASKRAELANTEVQGSAGKEGEMKYAYQELAADGTTIYPNELGSVHIIEMDSPAHSKYELSATARVHELPGQARAYELPEETRRYEMSAGYYADPNRT